MWSAPVPAGGCRVVEAGESVSLFLLCGPSFPIKKVGPLQEWHPQVSWHTWRTRTLTLFFLASGSHRLIFLTPGSRATVPTSVTVPLLPCQHGAEKIIVLKRLPPRLTHPYISDLKCRIRV